MKKGLLLILTVLVLFSCRKERQCSVTVVSDPDNVLEDIIDPENPVIEILECNCHNKTISEIENSLDYAVDSLDGADSSVVYDISCD